jgi:hypothetical protein
MINTGRCKVSAGDGSDAYRVFWPQADRATYELRSHEQRRWYVEQSEGHDDRIVSLALVLLGGGSGRGAGGGCGGAGAAGGLRDRVVWAAMVAEGRVRVQQRGAAVPRAGVHDLRAWHSGVAPGVIDRQRTTGFSGACEPVSYDANRRRNVSWTVPHPRLLSESRTRLSAPTHAGRNWPTSLRCADSSRATARTDATALSARRRKRAPRSAPHGG